MKEPSVAGVTFHVDRHDIINAPNGLESVRRYQGLVTLKAHFNRKDLWEAVIKRLDGATLYKGGDIQSDLIEILQGRLEILEKELEGKDNTDKERAQRAEQASSLARAEAARSAQHAELLQAQLDMRTRERDTYKQYLDQWQAWYDNHKPHCSAPQT